MNAIFVLASLIAVSTASPQFLYNGLGYGYGLPGYAGLTYAAAPAAAPLVAAAPIAPIATKTQYHAQDELGQASYGHSEPGQAHAAVRDAAGGVRGTFSYISPEGIPFTTHYTADGNGYRVASNALPIDTPEVQAAKIQHAAAHNDALIRSGRRKRALVLNSSPAVAVHHNAFGYAHHLGYSNLAPAAVTYAAAPVSTLSYAHSPIAYTAAAAPALTYTAAAPALTYTAAAPALTYAAAPAAVVAAAPAVRPATLTRVINTPGHAVSYRVD